MLQYSVEYSDNWDCSCLLSVIKQFFEGADLEKVVNAASLASYQPLWDVVSKFRQVMLAHDEFTNNPYVIDTGIQKLREKPAFRTFGSFQIGYFYHLPIFDLYRAVSIGSHQYSNCLDEIFDLGVYDVPYHIVDWAKIRDRVAAAINGYGDAIRIDGVDWRSVLSFEGKHALEIVQETCEYILAQCNPRKYRVKRYDCAVLEGTDVPSSTAE